jgi:hypothetical protein
MMRQDVRRLESERFTDDHDWIYFGMVLGRSGSISREASGTFLGIIALCRHHSRMEIS